jgi:nitronate monooxygenase
MAEILRSYLHWASSPLIVNAPMGGFAGGKLAAAVTQAGGLGMVGAIMSSDLEKELAVAQEALRPTQRGDVLPIGVGLLPFVIKLDPVLVTLQQYQPAVVWLFAAKELEDYAAWAGRIREVSPRSKIWIQTGTVSAALKIAQLAKPDALILQGADAGGHGFERGASIVSLLPEASDMLSANGLGDIPLLASGGIADARGAAAAFTLGASGVVLGTRFLAARETNVPPGYRDLVLAARDGATSTVRSKLFDNVNGPNIWPEAYDGRSLVTESYNDHIRGVGIDQIRETHKRSVTGVDAGFGTTNRANVWAGASVGLVNKLENAAAIVEEVRSGVTQILKGATARL